MDNLNNAGINAMNNNPYNSPNGNYGANPNGNYGMNPNGNYGMNPNGNYGGVQNGNAGGYQNLNGYTAPNGYPNGYPGGNVSPNGAPNGNDKKGKKLVIILSIVVGILLAAAVAIAIIFFLNSDEKKVRKELDLGQQYIDDMDYEEAIACFERALEIKPQSGEAYIGIAQAYISLEEYEKADEILEEGIKVLEKAVKKEDDDEIVEEYEEYIEELEDMQEDVEETIAEIEEEERIAALPYIDVTVIANGADNIWGRNWDEWNKEDLINTLRITNASNNSGSYKSADEKYMYSMSEYGDYVCEYTDKPGSNEQFGGKYINIVNEYSSETPMFPANYYFQQVISCPDESWKVLHDGLYDMAMENGIKGENGIMTFCNLSMDMFDNASEIEINTPYGVGTACIEQRETVMQLVINIPETEDPGIPDVICFRWNNMTENKDESYTMIGLGKN